jgi:hypothetical protein
MAFLTTLGLIAGGAGAVNNFLTGGKMAREAQQGLQKFKHQELTNLAENLKPSLEAEQQAISQIDKMRGSFTDVAQTMDAASAMAILGSGQEQLAAQEQKVFSSIMDKEFQADVMRVQDEQKQRDMIETRKMEELQSLKAQAQAGKQMQASAITDFASLAVSAGTGQEMADAEAGKTDPTTTRAAKAAARRGATGEQISAAYDKGGMASIKQLNIGEDNKGFLGGGTKVGGFFSGIGQAIGGFLNF